MNDDIGKFFKAFITHKFVKDSERVARDLILLILTTGLRSIEARGLQWKHVNFERKIFTIPDTKNRLDHTLPMVPLTYSLLRYRQEHGEDSEYVFRIKRESNSPY